MTLTNNTSESMEGWMRKSAEHTGGDATAAPSRIRTIDRQKDGQTDKPKDGSTSSWSDEENNFRAF